MGQVFVDADVVKLARFVPAVFARFDFVFVSTAADERSSTTPVVGIGILRPTF